MQEERNNKKQNQEAIQRRISLKKGEGKTMPDKEKVIKGLETIKQFFGYGLPSTAEMFDSYYGTLNDAIVLLKEQGDKITELKRSRAEAYSNWGD